MADNNSANEDQKGALGGKAKRHPRTDLREQRAEVAGWVLFGFSLGAFILMVVANFWGEFFIKWSYWGYAWAGAAINVAIPLYRRLERGDWKIKYIGSYAFRFLQATVYASIIYWLLGAPSDCQGVSDSSTGMPIQVIMIFVGMFVNLLEEAMVNIGERFVDAISAVFASRLEGPRQKQLKAQEFAKQLSELEGRYIEFCRQNPDKMDKEVIHLFEATTQALQSNENDLVELSLRTLRLRIEGVKFAQPQDQS